MAIVKDQIVEYTNKGYRHLEKLLRKTNLKIENISDMNKRINLIEYRYELEKEMRWYKKHLIAAQVENKESKNNDKVVRISDLISTNFHDYWRSKQNYKILKGGRSSLKSSAISLKLVENFLKDDLANVIAFRKVAKNLSTSVYEQIKWAIYMYGVESEFTFLKSPTKIVHNRTGSAFYFYGVDDPLKIKSHKIAIGYVTDLWFEEASEFDGEEEIDTVTDTFKREKIPGDVGVNIHFSYNPPKNQYNWVNKWVENIIDDDHIFVNHSTYLQDDKNFLSQQFIDDVERKKIVDPDYYDWMYLGKVIGLGDTVYNSSLFNIVNEIPSDDRILFADIAIDTGYSVSSTTFLFIAYTVKKRVILLDTFYYTPEHQVMKKAPSDFTKDLWDFTKRNCKTFNTNIDKQIVDSADGAIRNQYFRNKGISLEPARKLKKVKMIENVEDLLVTNRVYVLNTPNNEIFIDEHKMYQWNPDTKETDDPKVIKEHDHTCDAFQYYVNNNLSKLGLKI